MSFKPHFIDISYTLSAQKRPDFDNILKVLRREKPNRPTLFEFFLNDNLYKKLAGNKYSSPLDTLQKHIINIEAYKNAGYDYYTLHGSELKFPKNRSHKSKTISLNEGAVIHDRESFQNYPWPDPDTYDYSRLKVLKDYIPLGMKLIAYGPGGVLENVISLVGYESLCYMILDDENLVGEIFDAVGSRLLRYYEICSGFETVGALISNDDWGFNTQTLLSVDDMRKFVFPWHKRIVKAIHASGKSAILHSCGQLEKVMDDIIDDIKYDGKHSFEDNILPIEKAYERWGSRIAILGGIDVDFICRSTPEEIYNRSFAMLEMSLEKGGYALGSGNSIPAYVPEEGYLGMISAANFFNAE